MEGISAVEAWEMVIYGTEAYPRGREALIGDVNAVVDGLVAGGAVEIDVMDGHGSDVPDGQDLPAERLDKRARLLAPDPQWWNRGSWDAVVLVGSHAGPGSGGFLAHTGFVGGAETILNGISVSETELEAMRAGNMAGIPVIFDSGDDVLHRRISSVMPWVEFVEVKKALSTSKAAPYDIDQTHAALREGARRAVGRLAEAQVVRLNVPIRVTFRANPPMDLRPVLGLPGLDAKDEGDGAVSVSFVAPDFDSVFQAFVPLFRLGRLIAVNRLIAQALEKLPDHDDIKRRRGLGLDLFAQRWLEEEQTRAARERGPITPPK
jgi:D-amino peptidase